MMLNRIPVLERQSVFRQGLEIVAPHAPRDGRGTEPANVAPIRSGDILIDIFGLGDAAVKAIGAVAARAGDPEMFASHPVEIVRLEA